MICIERGELGDEYEQVYQQGSRVDPQWKPTGVQSASGEYPALEPWTQPQRSHEDIIESVSDPSILISTQEVQPQAPINPSRPT